MARGALLLALPLLLADHAGKVNWIMDPDAGMAQAKASGRYALLYFTGSWCGACNTLGGGALSDNRVVEATTKVVPIMVDFTNRSNPVSRRFGEKYGVRYLPTLILVNSNGEVVEKIEARDAATLASRITGPAGTAGAAAIDAGARINRGCSAVMLILILGSGVVIIGILGLIFWKLGYFSSEE